VSTNYLREGGQILLGKRSFQRILTGFRFCDKLVLSITLDYMLGEKTSYKKNEKKMEKNEKTKKNLAPILCEDSQI
jgi:hypothetical protein